MIKCASRRRTPPISRRRGAVYLDGAIAKRAVPEPARAAPRLHRRLGACPDSDESPRAASPQEHDDFCQPSPLIAVYLTVRVLLDRICRSAEKSRRPDDGRDLSRLVGVCA